MQNRFYEIIGWYGVGAILLAYALNSYQVINADSLPYQLLNLTGAMGIIAISLKKRATQLVILNIIWAVIALVAITNIML